MMSTEPTASELMQQAYKIAKRRHGMTQVQLADELGVKQQTISNWLNGTREPSATDFGRVLRACRAPQRIYLAVATLRDASNPGYLSRQRHRLSTIVPHTSHLAPSSPLPAAA